MTSVKKTSAPCVISRCKSVVRIKPEFVKKQNSGSVVKVMRHNDLDERIARMDRIVEKACQSPEAAKALLIQSGIFTKRGTLKKIYQK